MNDQHLKENILSKIRKDEIQMRPKVLFVLKAALVVLLGIVILTVSAWLLSLVLFDIRVSDKLFLLGFGVKGMNAFLHLFPWYWLILDIVLLVLLEYLWKRFSFAYHFPVLYVFIGLLFISGTFGLLLNLTTFNNALLSAPEEKRLPVIDKFYDVIRHPKEKREFVRGVITESTGLTVIVRNNDSGKSQLIRVSITPDMINVFGVGDKVFIAGDWDGEVFHAYGFKKYIFTPLIIRMK